MKANEAPDEIYLLPDDRNPNGLSICWYEAPYETGAIEYTRTDAFIEKAIEWFRRIDYDDSIPPFETTEEFIEGFKKAMKGE